MAQHRVIPPKKRQTYKPIWERRSIAEKPIFKRDIKHHRRILKQNTKLLRDLTEPLNKNQVKLNKARDRYTEIDVKIDKIKRAPKNVKMRSGNMVISGRENVLRFLNKKKSKIKRSFEFHVKQHKILLNKRDMSKANIEESVVYFKEVKNIRKHRKEFGLDTKTERVYIPVDEKEWGKRKRIHAMQKGRKAAKIRRATEKAAREAAGDSCPLCSVWS